MIKTNRYELYNGDCLEVMSQLPDKCVDLVVTSPPYNLKNSTGNGMKCGKGGKGVATMLGVVIGLFHEIIPLVLAVFVVVFIITHYISASSMSAAVSFPIFYATCSIWLHYDVNTIKLCFSIIVALFIIWTHRKNIKRLINKQEPKFKFKKTVD